MKMNPAEKRLYAILAERADMTLDEWIQSLPRQQLAQLEADAPDEYEIILVDLARKMLDEGGRGKDLPPSKQNKMGSTGDYIPCESCGKKRHRNSRTCKWCGVDDDVPDPEEVEAHKEPPPEKDDEPAVGKIVPAPIGGHTKKCVRCEEVKAASEFSIVAKNCCTACMEVAKSDARQAIALRNERA